MRAVVVMMIVSGRNKMMMTGRGWAVFHTSFTPNGLVSHLFLGQDDFFFTLLSSQSATAAREEMHHSRRECSEDRRRVLKETQRKPEKI